jgi:hypothetical protein
VILIPDKNNPCWQNLATGKKVIQTQFLGLQMILKRQQRHLQTSMTDATVKAAAEELHAFFVKYEAVLAPEINSL